MTWRADTPALSSWHPTEEEAMAYATRLVRAGEEAPIVIWLEEEA